MWPRTGPRDRSLRRARPPWNAAWIPPSCLAQVPARLASLGSLEAASSADAPVDLTALLRNGNVNALGTPERTFCTRPSSRVACSTPHGRRADRGGAEEELPVAAASMAGQGSSATGCDISLGPASTVVIDFAAVNPAGDDNLRAWGVATRSPRTPRLRPELRDRRRSSGPGQRDRSAHMRFGHRCVPRRPAPPGQRQRHQRRRRRRRLPQQIRPAGGAALRTNGLRSHWWNLRQFAGGDRHRRQPSDTRARWPRRRSRSVPRLDVPRRVPRNGPRPSRGPGLRVYVPFYENNVSAAEGLIIGAEQGPEVRFQVIWQAQAGTNFFFANWAYTAPYVFRRAIASLTRTAP